jgi:hypothetical protein
MLYIQEYGSRTTTTGRTLVLLVLSSLLATFYHLNFAVMCLPHCACHSIPRLQFGFSAIRQFDSKYDNIQLVPVLNRPATPKNRSLAGTACRKVAHDSFPIKMRPCWDPYKWRIASALGNRCNTAPSTSVTVQQVHQKLSSRRRLGMG